MPIIKEKYENSQSTLINMLKKSSNFKAPGTNKIQNIVIKKFTNLHNFLLFAFNQILITRSTPEWLVKGRKHLIQILMLQIIDLLLACQKFGNCFLVVLAKVFINILKITKLSILNKKVE